MADRSAKSTDRVHTLIYNDDGEYIFWTAMFEDEVDAKAALKIATEALSVDSGGHFYLDTYTLFRKGVVPDLDQIKAALDDSHSGSLEPSEIWQRTLEEKLEDVDPTAIVTEVRRLALEVFPGLITTDLTEVVFNLLHGERRLAISDWIDDPFHDIYKIPPELQPEGALPIVPVPGQQELSI